MGNALDPETGEFEKVYSAVLEEIDELLGTQSHAADKNAKYPDPVNLSPIQRRVLVRSIFACIEAIVFNLKQFALESPSSPLLSIGERSLAIDENYEISETGAVKKRPARIRFPNNLRFAMALFAKVQEIDYQFDSAADGWQKLLDAVKVRDRLAHPKTISDLSVNDQEIRGAVDALNWFHVQIFTLLIMAVKRLRALVSSKSNRSAV